MVATSSVAGASGIDAIEWARSHFAFERFETVAAAPWSTTYRLEGRPGSAYLKAVPSHQAGALAATARLAQRFAACIPPVLAVDATRGWLLIEAHHGRTLGYDAADDELCTLARTYAALQSEAAGDAGLLADLPRPDISGLTDRLLEFLRPQAAPDRPAGWVQADYFIGAEDAARYERLLSHHAATLRAHLAAAALLRPTLCHGDLRPPNAALVDGKGCVLFDWDDAMVGPAGMSLHGLFGGCTVPTILLSGSAAAKAAAASPQGRLLHAYLDTLVAAGYADVDLLERTLPAAICAGLIRFVIHFAAFPGDPTRADVADTLLRRLSNLVDLGDLLAARQPEPALALARHYEEAGETRRAQALVQDQVARFPGRVDLLVKFARLCRLRGDQEQAEEALREAVGLEPDEVSHRLDLAQTLISRLALDEAREQLARAVALDARSDRARAQLAHLESLQTARADARLPGRMPVLRYEPQALAAAGVRPEQVALGAELFGAYGTLQIDNAFPLDLIERLQAEFFTRYAAYFREGDHADALRLGDKRYMLTVSMDHLFGDPNLIGAATVLPIIRQVLGEDCVLGAYTAVVSLPGSRDQRLHKDHPALFPGTEWHFALPCFAAQIIIPLVPLDEFTGTTRFYKGTHKVPTEQAEATGHQDPVVPLGSCLLTDYRCAHRGLGNRSDRVRPILTLIYNRPWFHDYKNYGKQPPLRLDQAAYERLPEALKPLVAWWKEEREVVALDQPELPR